MERFSCKDGVIPLSICSDLKCIEYNNFYNVHQWIIFIKLALRWKFVHVKNKHVKYSSDLIWVAYGRHYQLCYYTSYSLII